LKSEESVELSPPAYDLAAAEAAEQEPVLAGAGDGDFRGV